MPRVLSWAWAGALGLLLAVAAWADDRVVVFAEANPDYSRRKFGDGQPQRETFVLMQGRFYGGARADPSITKMPFRQVVSYLLPKLAQQEFVPARSVAEADLLIVVHWGVTNPRVGRLELLAQTDRSSQAHELARDAPRDPEVEPDPLQNLLGAQDRAEQLERITDAVSADEGDRNIAQLLGYTRALRRLERKVGMSAEEESLRYDLRSERYFLIVRAYALRGPAPKPLRPSWILHLNVSSPGNNFRTAMIRMSEIATRFAGRSTERVETLRSPAPDFKVELGDLIILGEAR